MIERLLVVTHHPTFSMVKYALGPPDEEGYPSLIDLDAGSSPPDIKLCLIDVDDVVGYGDLFKQPKAAAKDKKGKPKKRDSGYAEMAEERAKERRREASRRYYIKYVARLLCLVQLTYQ